MHHIYHRSLLVLMLAAATCLAAPAFAQPAPAECDNLKIIEKRDSFMASPRDVRECQRRAYDPPTKWRFKEGKGSGVKASGASGFSYGTVTSPESPPSARNAQASVNRNVIQSTCSFPLPNSISLSWPPRADLRGSCLAFFNGTFAARDATPAPIPTPPGLDPTNACPAETDTTGIYGTKRPIAGGGSFPTPCGAMQPVLTGDIVLNTGADRIAVLGNNEFRVRVYMRYGSRFVLTQNIMLPSYLCSDSEYNPVKTMDLTPPVNQVIAFSGNSRALSIRLKSRETMNPNFIPEFDETQPELFLRLEIDPATGEVTAPPQSPCPVDGTYAVPASATNAQEDIRIQSAVDSDCENIAVSPTAFNDTIITCPAGATLDAPNKVCIDDSTNRPVPPASVVDNWVGVCPQPTPPETYSGPRTTTGVPLATGVCPACTCPQSAGVPNGTARCPNGAPIGNSSCLGIVVSPALQPFQVSASSCTTAPPLACNLVTLPTTTAACRGPNSTAQQILYGVLDRPNINFPEGSTAVLDPVIETSAAVRPIVPTAMARSVAGTRLYSQERITLFFGNGGPSVTLDEGGTLRLRDGTSLMLGQNAVINPSAGTIRMPNGGQRISATGVMLTDFANGQTYSPGALLQYPIPVTTGQSTGLPAGLLVPTMPNTTATPAYMRMPAAALPQ